MVQHVPRPVHVLVCNGRDLWKRGKQNEGQSRLGYPFRDIAGNLREDFVRGNCWLGQHDSKWVLNLCKSVSEREALITTLKEAVAERETEIAEFRRSLTPREIQMASLKKSVHTLYVDRTDIVA